ncbi:MAG: type 3 dihydrofolate reductase [Aeromonas sp.]
MKISLIAAMAQGQVIGLANQMPWHMPADLAHFKRLTLGKPVLMGRKTFVSIGRPLPGRRNVVLSRSPSFRAEGVEVFASLEALWAQLAVEGFADELMVIGGGALYQAVLAQAHTLYLTQIDLKVAGDTYFPAIDPAHWQRTACQAHAADARNPHPYQFETWQRRI